MFKIYVIETIQVNKFSSIISTFLILISLTYHNNLKSEGQFH